VPVIVASGYDAVDSAAHLPSDGHVRFLQKPFALEALVALVTEVSGFQSPASSAARQALETGKPETRN
jgi:DNA-binding NtrC family response regulator